VESGGPTFFPVGLGVEALVVKYSVLYQNKERTTHRCYTRTSDAEIYRGGESIGVADYSNWKFEKARGTVNCLAELPLRETGDGVCRALSYL